MCQLPLSGLISNKFWICCYNLQELSLNYSSLQKASKQDRSELTALQIVWKYKHETNDSIFFYYKEYLLSEALNTDESKQFREMF